MTNWFSIHRSIKKHWLFQEERTYSRFEAWFFILMETNHSEVKQPIGNQIVTIERGQFFTSKLKLSEKFNWSRKKLDAFLRMLERDNMVHIKSTTKYTVITVVNYDFYQSDEGRKAQQKIQQSQQPSEQHSHNNGTSNAQQTHITNNGNNVNNSIRAPENDLNESYAHVDKSKDDTEEKFLEFYDLYDKKKARPKAEQAFKKALKKHDFEIIMNGTKSFLKTITDKQYQPYPASFLNQEQYMDEHKPVTGNIFDGDNAETSEPEINIQRSKKENPLADVRHYENAID